MKRLLFVFGIILASVAFASSNSQPESNTENTESEADSTYFTPCDSWQYNSDVRGYICSFRGRRTTIPDQYEFQNLQNSVSQMERTIRDLENRIRVLEQRP
jgi:TolA-binding protein